MQAEPGAWLKNPVVGWLEADLVELIQERKKGLLCPQSVSLGLRSVKPSTAIHKIE
jgi:hypothetical protein